jgi:hypothetical protein
MSLVVFVLITISLLVIGTSAACDHSYGDATMRGAKVSDATCTEPAQYKAICTKCGNPSETVTFPFGVPLGHDYGAWTSSSGKHTRYCERSGCSYVETEFCSYTDPSMRGAKVSDATCTEPAQYKAICTICGVPSNTVTHPFGAPLGHSLRDRTYCDEVIYCSNSGCSYKETGSCSFGAWKVTSQPTCDREGVKTRSCYVCGKSETGTISALGHSFGEWITQNEASCEVEGYKIRYCSYCNKTESAVISSIGHTYGSWQKVRPASCTLEGIQKRTCSNCRKVESENIPMVNHKYVDNVCSVCGLNRSDETTKVPNETTAVPGETSKVPDETAVDPNKDGQEKQGDISLRQAVGVALGAALALASVYLLVHLLKRKD